MLKMGEITVREHCRHIWGWSYCNYWEIRGRNVWKFHQYNKNWNVIMFPKDKSVYIKQLHHIADGMGWISAILKNYTPPHQKTSTENRVYVWQTLWSCNYFASRWKYFINWKTWLLTAKERVADLRQGATSCSMWILYCYYCYWIILHTPPPILMDLGHFLLAGVLAVWV